MRINSTTFNMAAAIRRASLECRSSHYNQVSSAALIAVPSVKIRNFSDFRPLYSVTEDTSKSKQLKFSVNQQTRFANTSSGFYAPSSIVASNRQVGNQEPHGNLTVFEDSEHLPSLPVPNLNVTLERLKESISPVAMNSAEFCKTLQLIDEFAKSAGPKLDLLLRNKASQTKNWLTADWWQTEVYLKSRQPLVINSNPSMIYPTLPFEVNNQRALINTISQLISGIIDFKLSLIHGYNPEATSADNECRLDPNLCYNQYKNIFGSTRVPGEHVDSVEGKQSISIGSETNHAPITIVISYRGKFFEVELKDIEDEKGRIEKLSNILDKIIASETTDGENNETHYKETTTTTFQDGAGVLTAAKRDDWAQAYKLMDGDSMNAIQGAQFIVCIDTIKPSSAAAALDSLESSPKADTFTDTLLKYPLGSEQHSAALGRQVLHADSANIGNRWFDKALQFIVVADGNAEKFLGAGINYEHSFGEGTMVSKIIEYSYDKAVQKSRESSSSANFFSKQQVASQEPAILRQLMMFDESKLSEISKHLRKAKQDYVSQVDQFDLSYLDYKQYGSNAIKSWHFSPDSWFQVAMQSAYYNLHKRLGPCYESASTRRFAYGRTDTIRSLTKEVAQFCLEPQFETMQSAIQSHKIYANSANNGEAIDRALMGYKMTFHELKTNTWSWGLPTGPINGYDSQDLLKMFNNKKTRVAAAIGERIDIEDLFTEKELNIIIAFFNNELIQRSTRFALSTSQVPSTHPNIFMTYGPLLADGYGCCYNITGQQIVASITANSSNQSFSCEVHKLNASIKDSLDKMENIVKDQRSKSNT